jgi:hypothetical protein
MLISVFCSVLSAPKMGDVLKGSLNCTAMYTNGAFVQSLAGCTFLCGNFILQPHIVYKTMFYYSFRLHNLWCRYTIRFSFSTCFGLVGPSSGTLGLTTTYFFSFTPPTLVTIYTLGVRCMYGLFMMP